MTHTHLKKAIDSLLRSGVGADILAASKHDTCANEPHTPARDKTCVSVRFMKLLLDVTLSEPKHETAKKA